MDVASPATDSCPLVFIRGFFHIVPEKNLNLGSGSAFECVSKRDGMNGSGGWAALHSIEFGIQSGYRMGRRPSP